MFEFHLDSTTLQPWFPPLQILIEPLVNQTELKIGYFDMLNIEAAPLSLSDKDIVIYSPAPSLAGPRLPCLVGQFAKNSQPN